MNIENGMAATNSLKMKSLEQSVKNVKEDKALRESCQEFEAIFIKEMLKSMKSTVKKSGLIKENMGEKLFDDMLYDEYAEKMSNTSDFGIADMMYRQLSVGKYK